MAEPSAFAQRPRAAIEFLRQKLRIPTETWTDIWQEAHSRAFVVAGATKAGLIADFHEAVTRALESGSTLETFRKDFDAIVARHGWSYRGNREWRSQVIYQTNMSMAYSAGQWQGIQRLKDSRPYIGYFAVMDGRTRDQHRHWHQLVLPVDHPFWDTPFPPNGWNCRCWTINLSERDLKRYKLKVSDDPTVVTETRTITTRDGDLRIDVPRGVDPGFAYNPGRAAFGRGADLAALENGSKFSGLEAPGADLRVLPALTPVVPKASELPPVKSEAELRAQFRTLLNGRLEQTFHDPAGGVVHVGESMIDHILAHQDWMTSQRGRYFAFIPELVEDPAEIWVGFARNENSGRVLVRRRHIKLISLTEDKVLAIVADADGSIWSAITFYHGRPSGLKSLRTGALLWRQSSSDGSVGA